jgi:ubiquinone/menaquinone biosynthesis C-methylase UbiE
VNNLPGNQAPIIDLYRQRAKGYDASGIRSLEPWRKEAVKLLHLERGDLVVDMGCGTGLNFALVQVLLQNRVPVRNFIVGIEVSSISYTLMSLCDCKIALL